MISFLSLKAKILSLGTALPGFVTLKLPRNLSTLVARGHQLNASQLLRLSLPSFGAEDVVVPTETVEPLAVTRAQVGHNELTSSGLIKSVQSLSVSSHRSHDLVLFPRLTTLSISTRGHRSLD